LSTFYGGLLFTFYGGRSPPVMVVFGGSSISAIFFLSFQGFLSRVGPWFGDLGLDLEAWKPYEANLEALGLDLEVFELHQELFNRLSRCPFENIFHEGGEVEERARNSSFQSSNLECPA